MKTYKDVYKFPLRKDDSISWVYDNNNNFVFQFEISNEGAIKDLMDILLNKRKSVKPKMFYHERGYIYYRGTVPATPVILIRGWGNLTGIGAMNLKPEEAEIIQDTFAEYLTKTLNK